MKAMNNLGCSTRIVSTFYKSNSYRFTQSLNFILILILMYEHKTVINVKLKDWKERWHPKQCKQKMFERTLQIVFLLNFPHGRIARQCNSFPGADQWCATCRWYEGSYHSPPEHSRDFECSGARNHCNLRGNQVSNNEQFSPSKRSNLQNRNLLTKKLNFNPFIL